MTEIEKPPFLNVIDTAISQGRELLHQGVQRLRLLRQDLPFDIKIIEADLLPSLYQRLNIRLSRTLVLELHVARLHGWLDGETPAARFQSFIQYLDRDENTLALLEEYPVLTHQLNLCIEQWVSFSLEFLSHLCKDWLMLQETFSPNKSLATLIGVETGASDSHRGGRSVLIARFSSGIKIVYKPKSLAVDVCFYRLLEWINERGTHPPFKTLKVIDRQGYGWTEFVTPKSCKSTTELERFYERQGAYLALLYVIEATDFHLENIIAYGEYPMLIDLESLFEPHVIDNNAVDKNLMNHSVLRVGLLPQGIWGNKDREMLEISGLGGATGQLTPMPVPKLERLGTDQMRWTRERGEIIGGNNRPQLNGEHINLIDYTDAFNEGFIKLYRLFCRYREALLMETGPISCFGNVETRAILRPTQAYASLLFESFHPNLLRDMAKRDAHFGQLWKVVEEGPHFAKVIPAEIKDLWRGDIPMFNTRPNSRHIWTSKKEKIADFFDESGLTLVRCRLRELNEDDLKKQLWFIRASFLTVATKEDYGTVTQYDLPISEKEVSYSRLLTEANAIGKKLALLSLKSGDSVSWVGLSLANDHQMRLSSADSSLYSGLPGITLFIAYLGYISGEESYTALAKDALATIRQQIADPSQLNRIGGFQGWGGVLYLFAHLGAIWHEPELWSEAESYAQAITSMVEQDKEFDVISGAAGCIAGLLSLYHCTQSLSLLDIATECGEWLIAQAVTMETGIGWLPSHLMEAQRPLTGFSHGAAGIAWALLKLANATGEDRFSEAAIAAINYERGLFSPENGNWPDLRQQNRLNKPDDSVYATVWCHGAPGIGLSRLLSLPYFRDDEIQTEIDIALETTLEKGFGLGHSLCHGDLGNLELFMQADKMLNQSKWSNKVACLSSAILDSADEHGWLCGNPLRVEEPGLMTGLAGIGYQLLRLAEPDLVPSILALEPPKIENGSAYEA